MAGAISEISRRGERPSLLLHACCGPCSSSVLERLCTAFRVTVLFYNPNIHPRAEHDRRLAELRRFLGEFPAADGVRLIEAEYSPEDFFAATRVREEPGLAEEPEKGERCRRCYELRMRRAAEFAAAEGFGWFTTTLSVSPHKDAAKINEIGEALSGAAKFLPSDFKKRGGFLRSTELSAEYGLWRQDYCGCAYSMRGGRKANAAD